MVSWHRMLCPVRPVERRIGSRPRRRASRRVRSATPTCRGSWTATDADFAQVTDTSRLVLVDLWAPWCGPCRMVAPIVERLAHDFAGALKVVKVNVDGSPATSQRFQRIEYSDAGVPSRRCGRSTPSSGHNPSTCCERLSSGCADDDGQRGMLARNLASPSGSNRAVR